jgi:hypothetical protein
MPQPGPRRDPYSPYDDTGEGSADPLSLTLDAYLQQLQERHDVDLDTALRLAWLWPAP